MHKETIELFHELKNERNLERFIHDNNQSFMEKPLLEYIGALLIKYDVKKADVIKKAALTPVYGYQIFDGKREPKRDKIIQLAFGFGLSLEETQKLLKSAGYGELYPKVKRDVVFIYAINNKMSIEEVEKILFKAGEKSIEII